MSLSKKDISIISPFKADPELEALWKILSGPNLNGDGKITSLEFKDYTTKRLQKALDASRDGDTELAAIINVEVKRLNEAFTAIVCQPGRDADIPVTKAEAAKALELEFISPDLIKKYIDKSVGDATKRFSLSPEQAGEYRKVSEDYFKSLDANDNGKITLREMMKQNGDVLIKRPIVERNINTDELRFHNPLER